MKGKSSGKGGHHSTSATSAHKPMAGHKSHDVGQHSGHMETHKASVSVNRVPREAAFPK